jgi:hypothetical protein
MTKPTDEKFWTERGISDEVKNARPYKHWTIADAEAGIKEDISAVTEAYKGLSPGQRAYMTMLARQSDGLVIVRHAVPGAPKIYPEIRPDEKVKTGPPVKHYHGTGEVWVDDDAYSRWVAERCIMKRGTVAFEHHVRRINALPPEEKYTDPERGYGETDHDLVEGMHEHPDLAKYVFPPSGKHMAPDRTHDHRTGRTKRYYDKHPDAFETHLEYWHLDDEKAKKKGRSSIT